MNNSVSIERFADLVESIHLSEVERKVNQSDKSFLSIFPFQPGQGGLLADARDRESWKTWKEISFAPHIINLKQWASILNRALFSNNVPEELGSTKGIYGSFKRGVIVLIRSQKIIIIDRLSGFVIHILRTEYESDKEILENELLAHQILKRNTIPIICARLNIKPYFIVQNYQPHFSIPSRNITSCLGDVFSALFQYYDHFGWKTIDANAYIRQLVDKITPALEEKRNSPFKEKLKRNFKRIHRFSLQALGRTNISSIFVTKVHGDLIHHHIVTINNDGDNNESERNFKIVDWSESQEYSAFHDLFYLQFQNYQTDFLERFYNLNFEQYSQYYGKGWPLFWHMLKKRFDIQEDIHYIQLNFLIFFLQELDHRLTKLHTRYLPFWISQAEKIHQS